MKIWNQYPFVRLLMPFLTGIFLSVYFNFPFQISLISIILILTIIYGLVVFVYGSKITYSGRWYNGVLIHLILLLSGYEITRINTPSFESDNVVHFRITETPIIFKVIEPVVERPQSFKLIGRLESFRDSSSWKRVTGKVILYFQKDSLVIKIKYGDKLVLATTLNEISPPMNPGEFDYKRYLSCRGIYCQGYVKSGNWKLIESGTGNSLRAAAFSIRNYFLGLLEKRNIKGEEFAVASALLFGCTDYLDADQIKEYSGSGAMHILSVSGLHVGIIYLFLNSLLWFLDKRRYGKSIKACLLIFLIWIYALITGFSPSVLRASLMFSFIIAGEMLVRKPHIYNTIGSSAMILLITDPYFIMDVGFQLSYLAVIGIVWLYKPIYNLLVPANRFIRFIWQTSAVSIAATIITFPLSIYYFKQFPNLFIITNLIAVPLSTLIIYIGIIALAASPINFLSSFLSSLMGNLIWLLNNTISFIESQSFAVSKGIYITAVEFFLLFGIILSFAGFILMKKRNYLLMTAAVSVLFLVSATNRRILNLHQKRIVAYSINNYTALNIIDGKNDILLIDSALKKDQNKITYHILNNRIHSGICSVGHMISINQDFKNEHFIKRGDFMQFYNKSMVLIDKDFKKFTKASGISVDYIIISHDPDMTVQEITEMFEYKLIVFDKSNSPGKIKDWINECEISGISYYSLREKGAWSEKI